MASAKQFKICDPLSITVAWETVPLYRWIVYPCQLPSTTMRQRDMRSVKDSVAAFNENGESHEI